MWKVEGRRWSVVLTTFYFLHSTLEPLTPRILESPIKKQREGLTSALIVA
jgi:hypothetical protein